MHTRRLLVVTAAGVLCLAPAPASASDGESTASVTVLGGALEITVSPDAGNLGSRAETGSSAISGSLGRVQVTDDRSAAAGSTWTASAVSTAFTSSTGPAIPATAVRYTAGTITKVGTATYVAKNPTNLTGMVPVVTATEITGDNTATWNPTITVAVPGGMPAGVYTATITHSVV